MTQPMKRRILGPADYRGWALLIETIPPETEAAILSHQPGPHYAKRWMLGHNLFGCLVFLVRWRLFRRAPAALGGEPVLRMRLAWIDDASAPNASAPNPTSDSR